MFQRQYLSSLPQTMIMRYFLQRLWLLLSVFVLCLTANAQRELTATITGNVLNDDMQPIAGASVQILNQNKGVITNADGSFSIVVPAQKAIALVFKAVGFSTKQYSFYCTRGEKVTVTIKLIRSEQNLDTVVVRNTKRDRIEAGLITIEAEKALLNPSPIGGIESLIKVLVGSNNELSSQYNVRGGSYDENLVYVNDFEVFRPYLVRSGQQEGLSFINPELTGGVKFYNGGFQARYGDKMSSVLDVTYKKPVRNGGSAYMSLLEQGVHIEGVAKKQQLTYIVGARNRSNRNLLSSQETQGNYIPSSADIQGLVTWQAAPKWQLDALVNLSQTKFTLYPEESKLTSGVFSPLFAAALGLDIFFEGQEKDQYNTSFIGLSATHQPRKNLRLKWMLSYFNNKEQENIDITGAYLFGERDFDNASSTFGLITNPLGAGVFQNYSRNNLNIRVLNAQHKGSYEQGKHFLQWGNSIEQQQIADKLHEWERNDSAGYTLPYNPGGALQLSRVVKSTSDIQVTRFSGYIQDNVRFGDSSNFTLQAGLRYNYNTLNNELLISPRIGFSFKPKSWQKNIIFRGAVGKYDQPPFYREMRRYDGSVNTQLRAQKSWQASGGFDYSFELFQRPARVTTELYYKYMTDVVPYDIDNVRLRYFGENMAKAYAMGFETRLFGELVKDAESWVSIGFMRTRENLNNDTYTTYRNAAGDIIGPNSQDQKPVDSSSTAIGWLRRPTDRLITFGMFFQDYLSTNKNFKVYLNSIYGTNLPYNIPGSTRYRNALQIDPYIRIDIGFSALLLDSDKSNRRSRSPFRNFDNIWASFEIFNLIDRANTISYLLIKDFANNTYTMPNRLTPRLVNVKLVAKW